MENNLVNLALIITYIMMAIAVLAAIGLPLVYLVKNFDFAKAKTGFIRIGILLVVLLFSFIISSGEIGPVHEEFGISPTESKLIGGAIITTYMLVIGSVIVSIYSEVANKFR